MIRVEPPPEPEEFDEQCRQKGKAWLAEYGDTDRPRDFWTTFKAQLTDGFKQRCAYSAMFEPVGTIDHFLSWKNQPDLMYEWSNYRFASAWLNSSKQNVDGDILDPFSVEDDWFEIQLPSLQLVITERVPQAHRKKAMFTLERLHLVHDERVMRQRREWYRMYEDGELNLAGLEKKAPLIARAVKKKLQV